MSAICEGCGAEITDPDDIESGRHIRDTGYRERMVTRYNPRTGDWETRPEPDDPRVECGPVVAARPVPESQQ